MASSCSAPFVGTAIGFALARGPREIVTTFAALGVGMASPLLAVAAFPALAKLLPRPGRWMVWVPRVLGVALAITAAWLVWVLAQVSGRWPALVSVAALAALVGALALRRAPAFSIRRFTSAIAVVMAFAAVLAPSLAPRATSVMEQASQGMRWQAFNRDAIRKEVEAGKVVFVDVTAAWCLTCKVNETAVLDRGPVSERLRAPGVVAMRADWTRPEPGVTVYLQSFGRYGVPMNVVYGPGRPEGLLLPELLTSATVLEAMQRATDPARRTLTQR